MVHIDLSEEECAVLRDELALRLHDLRHEIHYTDSREFRTRLLREEDLLQDLLRRLGSNEAVGTH
jgi:hypothetical protein